MTGIHPSRSYLIGAAALALAATGALAADTQRHHRVDGMDVYLGVVPAELTRHDAVMHEGAGRKAHEYHVMVALFDSASGARITDAEVRARVSSLGMGGKRKPLERMLDSSVLSYGNYFTMPDPELYSIFVEIRRKGAARTSTAAFVYQRPLD